MHTVQHHVVSALIGARAHSLTVGATCLLIRAYSVAGGRRRRAWWLIGSKPALAGAVGRTPILRLIPTPAKPLG